MRPKHTKKSRDVYFVDVISRKDFFFSVVGVCITRGSQIQMVASRVQVVFSEMLREREREGGGGREREGE